MTATDDFERRMADHYQNEAAPRAPSGLLTRTLDTIGTTPQRRTMLGRPRRFAPMSSFVKVAVGAVAIVAVSFAGLTLLRGPVVDPAGSPSASPESSPLPSALPPPLTERFDSTFNGISIDYPAGWQTRPATETWTNGVLAFDEAGVDIIFDPTRRDVYFALASEPLRGLPDHIWRQGLTLPDCPGGHGGSDDTFDGASGFVQFCGGTPFGTRSALLTTDTRGYAFVLYLGDKQLFDTYSDAWFTSVLKTLDLHAEDAADASSPSESP